MHAGGRVCVRTRIRACVSARVLPYVRAPVPCVLLVRAYMHAYVCACCLSADAVYTRVLLIRASCLCRHAWGRAFWRAGGCARVRACMRRSEFVCICMCACEWARMHACAHGTVWWDTETRKASMMSEDTKTTKSSSTNTNDEPFHSLAPQHTDTTSSVIAPVIMTDQRSQHISYSHSQTAVGSRLSSAAEK